MAEWSLKIDPCGKHFRWRRLARCAQHATSGSVDDQHLARVQLMTPKRKVGLDETPSFEHHVQ
jgi:hypothetical protein